MTQKNLARARNSDDQRFQVAEIRFHPISTAGQLEARFEEFLSRLRRKARGHEEDANLDREETDEGEPDMHDCDLSLHDRIKIRRRVKAIIERRNRSSGMNHLDREARERLRPLENGVRLIRLESEHRADEIAAALHAEMPWMAPATEIIWGAMRESVRSGAPGLRLPPILLDGPPGIGKSHWARRLGELAGVPSEFIDAAAEPAGFAVAGSQRGWSSAHPGRPVELILRERVGNPIIVIDEIDKVGDVRSIKGHNFALTNALLPLLERLSARRWSCPYFRVTFDLGWVGWVLTSNTRDHLPAPLLSRCRVIALPPLSAADLAAFARREGKTRGLSESAVETLVDTLARAERTLDLRAVIRLIESLLSREKRPLLH